MSRFSIRSLAYASHAAIWFVTLITVAAERSAAVKSFLAGLSGHHWTAKSIIALLLFFATALIFANKEDPQDVGGLITAVLASAILGALAIFVFYLLHFYGLA
jgi:hypothetical protein